jgi:hypothetical protein
MKRFKLALFALGVLMVATTTAQRILGTRQAVAFDMSHPLEEQFIPDKRVVIHPAVESQPVRQRLDRGTWDGLG